MLVTTHAKGPARAPGLRRAYLPEPPPGALSDLLSVAAGLGRGRGTGTGLGGFR